MCLHGNLSLYDLMYSLIRYSSQSRKNVATVAL